MSSSEEAGNEQTSGCAPRNEYLTASSSAVEFSERVNTTSRCQKRKQVLRRKNASESSVKLPRCHENRKSQKINGKTDCPFCGVTLTCNEYSDHVKIHTLDLFELKRVKKRAQQIAHNPSHKKDYANVLKQRCERPQAHSLCSKSETVCPFCRERFVWRTNEEKQVAKNHLESCKEHHMNIAQEILQEVPSSSAEDFAADLADISDDYLGSDMLRITGSDENEILDIENDDTVLYGPSQYSDGDIAPLIPEITQNSSNSAIDLDNEGGDLKENCVDASSDEEEEQSWQQDYLTVEGLKRKVKELQETRGAMCPVCKDVYRTPLTAIGCWHVLCESCWLRALAVKKICPVCKTIVSSDALRKVYI